MAQKPFLFVLFILGLKIMPLFQNATFVTTVAKLDALPEHSLCEIAFAGRSNAGKSSAINALANHNRLAFVSKMPGRTQLLNFFSIAENKYFVDLPGYGFAKAPSEVRSEWEGLLAPYLRQRAPLKGLVLIMDIRHPLTDLDIEMMNWFFDTQKPIHILLSKADKLTRQEQDKALFAVRDATKELGDLCSVQLFSSTKKTGIAACEKVLANWFEIEWIADKTPPKRLRTEKTARPKNRAAKGWSARST